MTKIIITGANGKMGKVVKSVIDGRDDCKIVAGVDIYGDSADFPVYRSISDVKENADVVIDFSNPSLLDELLAYGKENKAALYVNVGDYRKVWDSLKEEIPAMKDLCIDHMGDWSETEEFANAALKEDSNVVGIHGFWHKNIFEAVYCTNLLMRSCDVMVTKPSELAFYPVPKLFIKRVGKHEMWGAIHSAEMGDGTLECRDIDHTLQMVDMFMNTDNELKEMCENIMANKKAGLYDGAYKVVEAAMALKTR